MSTHIRGVGIFAAHLFHKDEWATRTQYVCILTALIAKCDVNILRVRRRERWNEGYAQQKLDNWPPAEINPKDVT